MLRQQLSRPTLQDDRDAFVYAMIELETTARSSNDSPVGLGGASKLTKGKADMDSCSARVCLDDCNVLLLAGQFEVSDPTVHRDEPRNMLIQKPSLTYLVTPLV
ncbi:hypothetical protein KCU70_g397, partial [Aureobasidium melanogenum]